MTTPRRVEELTLRSSAGALRARHDAPAGPPPAAGPRAAVVCHPHPVQGGTMDNKVVHSVAKALREAGLHVLRFNFRGAGGSEGAYDEGRGELDDARAALDAAAALLTREAPAGAPRGADLDAARPRDAGAEAPAGSLLMAGFSFGSYVGLDAALDDPRVGALLAVAPPVHHYDYSRIAATDKPLAVIYALADELVPAALVEAFIARCARPPRVTAVPGAGHLFHGKLGEVRAAVRGFLDDLAPPGC